MINTTMLVLNMLNYFQSRLYDKYLDSFIILLFQFCEDADNLANEVKKELTDQALTIRRKLIKDIRIVAFLLKTHAATDFTMSHLLEGIQLN